MKLASLFIQKAQFARCPAGNIAPLSLILIPITFPFRFVESFISSVIVVVLSLLGDILPSFSVPGPKYCEILIVGAVDVLMGLSVIPVIAHYTMISWSSTCIYRSMSWSCISWHIVEMQVFHSETLIYKPFEAFISKIIIKSVDILISHLIDNDPNY